MTTHGRGLDDLMLAEVSRSPNRGRRAVELSMNDDRSERADRDGTIGGYVWLTYAQAAAYTGWSIAYLRNLVSAGQIPVYGKPRVRRFRQDMLDSFLADPDVAMRKFRLERERAT